jgi:butyrate kinase
MCFSGKYSKQDMLLKLKGRGGLVAYTGTSDCIALEKYILTGEIKPGCGLDPDKVTRDEAREAVDAMGYQICKEIGAMATVLEGKVDAIVLTGGLAYDKVLVPEIKRRVSWIAQVLSYPGGDEMTALRTAAETALRHPGQIKKY